MTDHAARGPVCLFGDVRPLLKNADTPIVWALASSLCGATPAAGGPGDSAQGLSAPEATGPDRGWQWGAWHARGGP